MKSKEKVKSLADFDSAALSSIETPCIVGGQGVFIVVDDAEGI